MSFNEDDPALGRINFLSITPPFNVSSLKAWLAKVEGIGTKSLQLFKDLSADSPMSNSDSIAFLSIITQVPQQMDQWPSFASILQTHFQHLSPWKSRHRLNSEPDKHTVNHYLGIFVSLPHSTSRISTWCSCLASNSQGWNSTLRQNQDYKEKS